MTDQKKKCGGEADAGSNLWLGNLLGDLGTAVTEMIVRLEHGTTGEIRRDHEFTTERGLVRAHAGIHIRLAGSDVPRVKAGAAPLAAPQTRGPASAPARAPAARPIPADIVDDGRTWRLTADLPGATREDLVLAVEDGDLFISAHTRMRSFADRIALPAATALGDLQVSLQNGILEIEAPSAKRRAP